MEAVNLLKQQQNQNKVHKEEEEEEAYTEEHREIGIATLTLVHIMNSTPTKSPMNTMPYVPSLQGIVTQCSQPFGKELTKSDVNGTQSRLLISRADAQTHIYPLLGKKGETNIKYGICVKVFSEYGKEYKMVLKSWSQNNKSNVLTSGWTAFVKDMELEAEVDYVTLWAFRHGQTGDVCFLIAVRRTTNNGVGKCCGGSSSSGNN